MIDFSNYKTDKLDLAYFNSVKKHLNDAKLEYPWIEIVPTNANKYTLPRIIHAVLVSGKTISKTLASKDDYLGDFSREAYVIIPSDYQKNGCIVLAGKWIDLDRIPYNDRHINKVNALDGMHELCVGVPNSFSNYDNPITASLKTAENMLIAYSKYLDNRSETIDLIAYSHGEEGVKEYANKRKSNKRR